jgi:hypothetical protein
MATYKVYAAVRKAQAFFETQKDAGTISYAASLKEADGSFDGKWGDDTQEAMWAYLIEQPEGTDLGDLVAKGAVTSGELATINQAIREYNVIKGSGGTGGGGGDGGGGEDALPVDLTPSKIPLWKWVMGGTLVATGGVIVFLLVKYSGKKSPKALRPAHARGHAGLAGLSLTDLEEWVNNDEGLYSMWKSSRQSLRSFVKDNRAEITQAVEGVLNRGPATKTWRDYGANESLLRR